MAHASTPGLTHPVPADQADTQARWKAHLDAGRIGRRLPVDPAIAAIRDANEAILLGRNTAR